MLESCICHHHVGRAIPELLADKSSIRVESLPPEEFTTNARSLPHSCTSQRTASKSLATVAPPFHEPCSDNPPRLSAFFHRHFFPSPLKRPVYRGIVRREAPERAWLRMGRFRSKARQRKSKQRQPHGNATEIRPQRGGNDIRGIAGWQLWMFQIE
jgi:hypothetical protein